jgi:ADP-ribose pyrophosphatase YjhB (NUDIX family)
MPALTVNVAVLHENQVLLTKRDDFEIWCLPSGGVEEGETIAQAALRETKEETGLDVRLTAVVGIYSRMGGIPDTHAVLFRAEPVGGALSTQPGETIEVRYFQFDQIPEDLSFGHRKRIEDAIAGIGGSLAVKQEMVFISGQKPGQKEVAKFRKQPREVRIQLFKQVMEQVEIRVETEVGNPV